jgi:hypothetical protein
LREERYETVAATFGGCLDLDGVFDPFPSDHQFASRVVARTEPYAPAGVLEDGDKEGFGRPSPLRSVGLAGECVVFHDAILWPC